MMLIVTTVYEGIDEAFINEFAARTAGEQDIDLDLAMKDLLRRDHGQATDYNPEDKRQRVTTTYRVIRQGCLGLEHDLGR